MSQLASVNVIERTSRSCLAMYRTFTAGLGRQSTSCVTSVAAVETAAAASNHRYHNHRHCRRGLTTVPRRCVDMDGNILAGQPGASDAPLLIQRYGSRGFTIGDRVLYGPAALVPGAALYWKINTWADVTIESLNLFSVVHPSLEILVLGSGDRIEFVDPAIRQWLKQEGILLEVASTPRAAAAYNFLSEEGRV
eukprot:UC1_evm1s171